MSDPTELSSQEINEAVAKKLGYRVGSFTKDGIKYASISLVKEPLIMDQCSGLPDYCGSISAAWEIVERTPNQSGWQGEICSFELKKHQYGFSAGWGGGSGWVGYTESETAPMAICKAFLKIRS